MSLNQRTVGKLYWTIGEVAAELGVNTSVLRYWEKEFGSLRPRRGGRGDRLYTREDIDRVKRIHHLLKEQGFTIQGAREHLRRKDVPVDEAQALHTELRDRLIHLREQLHRLREDLRSGQ
ncbi:MAG: MerR family transcriptional regulator [Flavobacteriales bacterium]|nr:MerR family transcriptional regulator [Flavobacteriales bacterium]